MEAHCTERVQQQLFCKTLHPLVYDKLEAFLFLSDWAGYTLYVMFMIKLWKYNFQAYVILYRLYNVDAATHTLIRTVPANNNIHRHT